MPSSKLTDTVVRDARLPDGSRDITIWDTELTGFGLRLRPTGKAFIFAYRPSGMGRRAAMKRHRLGPVAAFENTTEARKAARVLMGRIAAGADPNAEKRARRMSDDRTVAAVLDRYEEHLARRGYVNKKTVMAELRSRLAPHLKGDIGDLKGAALAAISERLEAAGKAGAAKSFRSRCSAFLAFCVTTARVLDAHPMAGFRKQRATRQDHLQKEEHGRALSDAELAKVWKAADPETSFGALVRFLVLTGCRRKEGALLRRSMRKGTTINLPATVTKQGRLHPIHVAPLLAELLDDPAPEIGRKGKPPLDARDPDLVFPSPRTGQPMQGWSKLVPAFVKACGVDFDLHDLRRSFRTGLSRLGVDPEVAEIAAGHKREHLVEIYERDRQSAQVEAAFRLWAEHLHVITNA